MLRTVLSLNSWTSAETGFFFVMLFTAADFSWCLFVARSVFSFVFSEWNTAQSGLDQEIHSAITFRNSWIAFAVCVGHCSFVLWSTTQSTLLHCWTWAESISLYTSELIRLLLSSVSSSLNTVTQSHWSHAFMRHTAPCFTDDASDYELFRAFSTLFSSLFSGTGWS